MKILPGWLPLIFLLSGVALAWAVSARRWTDRAGRQIEAELVRIEGDIVELRTPAGRIYRVPAENLSEADRDYVRSLVREAESGGEAAGAPLPSNPPDVERAVEIFLAPPVSEADFMRVMRQSCVRCHRVCDSVDTLVASGWLRPGEPDRSRVFTNLGKHRKPEGDYHNLPEEDRRIIREFIANFEEIHRPAERR